MKIRDGFVSNSSSSSFICPICGEDEGCEEDAVTCVNYHSYCKDHIDEVELIRCIMMENENAESNYPFLFKDDWYNHEEDIKLLGKKFGISIYSHQQDIPEEICPICNLGSLDCTDLLYYLAKRDNFKLEDIKKEIRSKFKNNEELSEYKRK